MTKGNKYYILTQKCKSMYLLLHSMRKLCNNDFKLHEDYAKWSKSVT